jgi:IclR family transcriptional regulator, pca regulon regulatory protein
MPKSAQVTSSVATAKKSVPISASLQRRDWIAGLEKGLGLLECFGQEQSRLSVSQIAELSGLARTAARRYLLTLVHLGYVATDGKLYWLTPRVLRLSQAYLSSSRLARIAQPFLQRLAQGLGEGVYLSVMEGDHIVYIARQGSSSDGGRLHQIGYMLGTLVPAHITAAGMVLLALRPEPSIEQWLERTELKTLTVHSITDPAIVRQRILDVRLQGWAVSEQQIELMYRGLAVPVRDARGNVVAALSVTTHMGKESADHAVERMLAVLNETAASMRNLI